MNFPYKISVIVPAYNVENYIEECLGSLVNQTIDKKEIEVIIVDDSSTDNTGEICLRFCSEYDFFKYHKVPNAGVSAARNFGIKHALGKYIMYLDSDDHLTEPSIKNIVEYFDSVYDSVDLVTYFIQPYCDEKELKSHKRYDGILTHTGVYDLEENPYIIQTTMNICVKNLGKDNILFNENMEMQEDQEYINRVLCEKLKIGYCAEAVYMYNRNNESSSSTFFYAYYIFEKTLEYFEKLFAAYEDKVPRYFQALFFHDLRWKLQRKILYPFHYSKKDFQKAMKRIKALLARVDVDIITKNPSIDKHHIHYWLNLKPNVFPCPVISDKSIDIVADGKTIEREKNLSVKITKIEQTDGGKFRIRAISEMNIFNYLDDEPKFYAIENSEKKRKIKLFQSKFSYVKTNIPTNRIYGFSYIIDPEKVSDVCFKCVVDSYTFDVKLKFGRAAVFNHKKKKYSYARGEYIISYLNDSICFAKATKEEIFKFEKNQVKNFTIEEKIAELKIKAIKHRFHHRVWLYSDLATVKIDNGYYQFVNDFDHDDGIERYYVYTRPYEEIESLFTEEQKKYLVRFGSSKHKLLYLSSELIISSFFGRETISPFKTEADEVDYYDIEHFKIIYMQHGVLHASYVNKYSAENAKCDKVVVSTKFEIKNFTKNYAFKKSDLIQCGMPRYEFIDREGKPQDRILFAPSWRSYLAKNVTESTYKINMRAFRQSDYYINFERFLSNKKLQQLLEEYNLTLDVKLHPIIAEFADELFNIKNERINIIHSNVNLSDYKAFITDFSSFVFDYAYLCRPIIYFVPDYKQFKSGMNLYRKLDLPFKKAFGNLSTDYKSAVDDFEGICKRDFVPEELFEKRMKSFYLPMDNCRENIYNYIIEKMF